MNIQAEIESVIGTRLVRMSPLSGGSIGQVYECATIDGERYVVKVADDPVARLDLEGYMLTYLEENSRLPVPRVIHESKQLLVMEYVSGESIFSINAERHAAKLLAELHDISDSSFGFKTDTLIAALHQPNTSYSTWVDFFRYERLLYMANEAFNAGRLNAQTLERIENMARDLDRWLIEPRRPSLVHGDVWTTNVLSKNGQITAFIDPAIYFASYEIELAFITLFGTFGQAFFDEYKSYQHIDPGFFEERRDIYNLYPLLVHTRLFGGSYAHSVTEILSNYGY